MRTLLRVLLWSCLVMVTWSLYVLNISPPAEAEAGDHEDLASSLQPATSGTSCSSPMFPTAMPPPPKPPPTPLLPSGPNDADGVH